MKRILITTAFLAISSTEVFAQATTSATPTVAGALRRQWQTITGYITKAAEQMPESDYAYKPTPQVRSFGELIGHMAGAQDLICANALAETPKGGEDAVEKSAKTKAQLVAALKASTQFCERAYNQPDAGLSGATKLFGSDATRLDALVTNTVHNGEHYGNIVTYMRMKGMVPPSSQPSTTP